MLARRESELATLLGLGAEHDALVVALGRAQGDYDFLRAKMREAELKEAQSLELGYLQVVEPARTPLMRIVKRFQRRCSPSDMRSFIRS